MDLNDLPGYFEEMLHRAERALPSAMTAQAAVYNRHLQRVTLRRFSHPPQTRTPSPPFSGTPAWISGQLSRSFITTPGRSTGPSSARASVGSGLVYARPQEKGATISPIHKQYLSWLSEGKRWWSKGVILPPRPYLEPAARDVITDGSLKKAAQSIFEFQVFR